ncbi:unnamed protein product [Closterium sp. NIES-54]
MKALETLVCISAPHVVKSLFSAATGMYLPQVRFSSFPSPLAILSYCPFCLPLSPSYRSVPSFRPLLPSRRSVPSLRPLLSSLRTVPSCHPPCRPSSHPLFLSPLPVPYCCPLLPSLTAIRQSLSRPPLTSPLPDPHRAIWIYNLPLAPQYTVRQAHLALSSPLTRWIYNPRPAPQYTAESCTSLGRNLACQRNGRPDSEYEKYTWRSFGCTIADDPHALPRITSMSVPRFPPQLPPIHLFEVKTLRLMANDYRLIVNVLSPHLPLPFPLPSTRFLSSFPQPLPSPARISLFPLLLTSLPVPSLLSSSPSLSPSPFLRPSPLTPSPFSLPLPFPAPLPTSPFSLPSPTPQSPFLSPSPFPLPPPPFPLPYRPFQFQAPLLAIIHAKLCFTHHEPRPPFPPHSIPSHHPAPASSHPPSSPSCTTIVGDSLTMNLFSSLQCLVETVTLTEGVEGPLFPGGPKTHGIYVPAFNATLLRHPSSFLTNSTPEGDRSSASTWTVHLDQVNPDWSPLLQYSHYALFGTGTWYTMADPKKRHYMINNTLQPEMDRIVTMQLAINTVRKFTRSLKYTGMPMFLTFTPMHYDVRLNESMQHANCSVIQRPLTIEQVANMDWAVDAVKTRKAQLKSTVVMATPSVLAFDAEGRAIDFDVWIDDLQLFLQCDRADGLSLFDLTSGASPAPAADADATVRSQWATRDAAARLAVRRHLPTSERAHISQYKSAQTLYAAVVARYSSPATAALSRLMLPYLFPDLAAFPTVADLITHLRTSDTRYRAALPADEEEHSRCRSLSW